MSCKTCGEIFQNEELYLNHNRQFNSIVKPKVKKPRVYGRKITEQDLTCSICLKVFKSRNSVREHQKQHDVNRRREYTCERCGKAFFKKGALKIHIQLHDNIKPHNCKICNKSFLTLANLRAHVNVHSGLKPFTCEECGKNFRLLKQLSQHKIIHTDQMPYGCEVCGKSFRFKQILKNHKLQHSGVKPYSCTHCDMVFTNWANFNKHMVRKHKRDMSKKKITPDGIFPVNPDTGKLIEIVNPVETEEWRNKIMIPLKRGKKKKDDIEQK